MPKSFDPHDRVVVVTGAGSGIGRSLALRAAHEGARAVAVCDIDEAAARETAAILAAAGVRNHHAIVLDVADEARLREAVAEVENRLGPIDLWCSNAGVHRGVGIGTDDDWERSLAVHVRAHVNVARHVVPRMVARGQGWLMVTASAAGLLSDVTSAPYTASKHAAVALAEWLSVQYDEAGLTVACLCPQGVKTNMNTNRRDGSTGAGPVYLEADAVAADAFDALRRGDFLILPHPEVASYELRRARDRERWLVGMRRLAATPTSA